MFAFRKGVFRFRGYVQRSALKKFLAMTKREQNLDIIGNCPEHPMIGCERAGSPRRDLSDDEV